MTLFSIHNFTAKYPKSQENWGFSQCFETLCFKRKNAHDKTSPTNNRGTYFYTNRSLSNLKITAKAI